MSRLILQVNINGIKNKLEEGKLFIHDTHAYIITIQETKLFPKSSTPKVHNFTTLLVDRLHMAGGGLITLIRDNITFTTTDIPLTINTHNPEVQMVMLHIKTLNISQLQTFIYLLETAHPRTTKQLTRTYNIAYSTSKIYHTQSSPEMRTHTPLSDKRTLMTT